MKLRRFLRTAVLTSLTIGAVAVATDRPSMISGLVLGEGKPLTGVLISDGCRVVRTNDQGEYQLAVGPDSGRFVFVTTPQGWWSESFYVGVDKATETGQANFHLDPIDQPNRFDFVFTCDLASPKPWAIPKLKASIHETRQKAKDLAKVFGMIEYDAIALGERDLAFGPAFLQSVQEEFDLPFLCANALRGGELLFPPYRVVEKGGVSVGFLAVVAPERHIVAQVESPLLEHKIEIRDPTEFALRYLPS